MNSTKRPIRAVLALAGLATTSALLVGCGDDTNGKDDTAGSDPTTSQTPTDTPSPTSTDTPGNPALGQPLDTRDLELGDAPGIAWLEGRTLHTPDGNVTLPIDAFQVVRYDDGWLALASADDDGYVGVRLTADGDIVDETPSGDRIATSADGDQVLWIEGNALTLHDNTNGSDIAIAKDNGDIEPVAVEGGVAYFNVGADEWPADGRYWSNGKVHDPLPGDKVPYTGANVDGLTTELSSLDDFGSCSTLRSPHGNDLGETCDFTLDGFSPDGAHLLAGPSYRDGFGDGELAVLPAVDGGVANDALVLHYQRDGDRDPFFLETAWEDAEHFLVLTFTPEPGSAKGTWQIIRIGLDGSVEDAVDPVVAADLEGPFSLA